MNRNTILVIWLGWHQLTQYLWVWRWQKFQFFHALMLLSVLKAVIWRGIITSSQPGTAFETVEADICSCWALGQCTLIHGREKCHYSQRVFSSCICHLSLSISITHKEQAQGMAIMFTLLQFIIYQIQDICSYFTMALWWNRQLKSLISCYVFQDLKRLYYSHNKGPSKVTCGYQELENSPE